MQNISLHLRKWWLPALLTLAVVVNLALFITWIGITLTLIRFIVQTFWLLTAPVFTIVNGLNISTYPRHAIGGLLLVLPVLIAIFSIGHVFNAQILSSDVVVIPAE